jgi:hypothetical protein
MSVKPAKELVPTGCFWVIPTLAAAAGVAMRAEDVEGKIDRASFAS